MTGGLACAGLEFAVALLPLWGFPQGTGVSPAGEQGTNNRTFLACCGQQRYVLRVSGFLSVAEVRAEHRILRRLRMAARRLPWHRQRGSVRAPRPGHRAAWRGAGRRAAPRGPAGLADRPALGPAGYGPVAGRARALRRGHSPCRQAGGDHAVARGQRGCVAVRRDRREHGLLTANRGTRSAAGINTSLVENHSRDQRTISAVGLDTREHGRRVSSP
jgi:hypothetical protein